MDACPSQNKVLRELQDLAPGVPLLALGQTVFWDEPMKAGLFHALKEVGQERKIVAGVHDTDYFAKFATKGQTSKFKALTHNDTTTKGLWSAAGEFSCLFGSETVVTREALQTAGAKLGKVNEARPGILDELTEAWGWRGVVSLSPDSKVTAEVKLKRLFPELFDTFQWAVDETLKMVAGPHREMAEKTHEQILAMVCNAADEDEQTLSDYYEKLIPPLWKLVGGADVDVETARTSRLLQFNSHTAGQKRFDLLDLFLNPKTRERAENAYNDAVRGSEIYTLDRFGVGALPFDVVIPGVGRGTLRLGTRGGLVMASHPVGFSFKKTPESTLELATLLERRFGPDCVLVGKAVTLIGMLAREFVFVFHDGASGYVHRSRKLHQTLNHQVHPVLRIKYEPWDALSECCAWLTLPEPMRRGFGVSEVSGPSLAVRWREVVLAQEALLKSLAILNRPLDLVVGLQQLVGGHWTSLSAEYQQMHTKLEELSNQVMASRAARRVQVQKVRELKAKINQLQHQTGEHWRAHLFGVEPTVEARAEREAYLAQERDILAQIAATWAEWRRIKAEQDELVSRDEVRKLIRRRSGIALEAELTRMRLVREAVITSRGLTKAGHRPSAWWFPLVCPDGTWFRTTARSAQYWLEPLH